MFHILVVFMLFYLFSLCAIFRSIRVLIRTQAVYSVFFLILAFFNVIGLLFLIQAEALGFILLIVYVGAIAILFLFVIIILDLKNQPFSVKQLFPILPSAIFLLITFFGELILNVYDRHYLDWPFEKESISSFIGYVDWYSIIDDIPALTMLGQVCYTHYFFDLIVGGLILLVALVGSVICVLPSDSSRKSSYRYQQFNEQLVRRQSSAFFLVKIKS